jgi:hypothetical protein
VNKFSSIFGQILQIFDKRDCLQAVASSLFCNMNEGRFSIGRQTAGVAFLLVTLLHGHF